MVVQRSLGDGHLVGESAEPGHGDDPVAGAHVLDCRTDGGHLAGDLAPGDERRRRLDLIAALADQTVDVVDAGGAHVDDGLIGARRQRLTVLDHEVVERSQLLADDGAHGRRL